MAKDIWESIPPAEEKLSEVADRTARERYITAKYVQRKYVQRPASLVDDEVRYAALQAAAMANDYVGVLRLLAQGADPNRSSMLALLTQDPSVSPHTIELLLQNNAKAGAADERGAVVIIIIIIFIFKSTNLSLRMDGVTLRRKGRQFTGCCSVAALQRASECGDG